MNIESSNNEIITLMDKVEKLKQDKRLDDAVSIVKNELLPIIQKAGEQTDLAMTYTVLADIYQELGKIDDAKKILKEQVLPRLSENKNDFLSELASTIIADLLPGQDPTS